jgi:phage shock protein C
MPEKNKLRLQGGLFGVCGGLGEFFGINPWWFRIIFLILLIPGGLPGIIPYLILWMIIPRKEDKEQNESKP